MWWRPMVFLFMSGLLAFKVSTTLALVLLGLSALAWGITVAWLLWEIVSAKPPRFDE